jgi:hypothetical protein
VGESGKEMHGKPNFLAGDELRHQLVRGVHSSQCLGFAQLIRRYRSFIGEGSLLVCLIRDMREREEREREREELNETRMQAVLVSIKLRGNYGK